MRFNALWGLPARLKGVLARPHGSVFPSWKRRIGQPAKSIERFSRLSKGSHIYLHGSKLRYDIDTREFSLHGGVFSPVDAEQFPILNTIILSGRCVKNIDTDDAQRRSVEICGKFEPLLRRIFE